MCVAILTLPTKVVPADTLGRYFDGNRDGAGFAYIDPLNNAGVVIDKGYFKKEDFLDKYADLVRRKVNEKFPVLIHARIATMGKKNRDNCHPFRIRGGALIHNGVLWSGSINAEMSDTREFAHKAHNILTYDDLSVNIERMSKAVGSYNKLAMLFDDGRHIIINEEQGTWQDGVWYSNSYHLRRSNRN